MNKKSIIYSSLFIVFILILVIFIYLLQDENIEENIDESIVYNNSVLDSNSSSGNVMFMNGNFSGAIDHFNKLYLTSNNEDEKVQNAIGLTSSILNNGNYNYTENESSYKALEILNNISNKNWKVYYNIGYSYEIIKNYEKALENYNKALSGENLENGIKSLIINQIGHTNDLIGNIDEAYKNYISAYELNNVNYFAVTNIGRSLVRFNKIEEAIIYFNYALNTENIPLRAEVYYSLSSLELELGGLNSDIDKSIEYAKKSVEIFPIYSMGYLAIARGLYMKNDKSLYDEIEKNISKTLELNKNSSNAYELLGLLAFDKGDLLGSLVLLANASELIKNDIILMDDQREILKTKFDTISMILNLKNKVKNNILIGVLNDKVLKNEIGRKILIDQLKRVDYGIFKDLKGNEKFEEFVKNNF